MSIKFSQEALLNAAAILVAARLQASATLSAANGGAQPAGSADSVSQMLVQAMSEVLGGVELMEDQAKTESMDLWGRLAGE